MTEKEANAIWVFMDLRNQRFFGFSLNALAKARELAGATSGSAVAVVIGPPGGERAGDSCGGQGGVSTDEACQRSLSGGADRVYVLENETLVQPRADLFARVLSGSVRTKGPRLVLFVLNDFGRELAARTARLCNGGLIADCADLQLQDDSVMASCPSWGGEIMAQIAFSGRGPTGFATVQSTIAKATEGRGDPGTIERLPVDGMQDTPGLRLVGRRLESREHRRLEEADTVVVGGAGLGSAEGFGSVRELAAALGGEVGATRPPVLQHWADEASLIGQTGKTVRPKLLFSIGTSGAVQYTAGIMEARTIVAINRDEKSPIFRVADFGIVGDWKAIVPLLTAKVKQILLRRLTDVLCQEGAMDGQAGFGARVRKLRQTQGWSLEQLAQAADQSPEYVAQVEGDEVAPPVGFLLRIARALGVDPGLFLRDEEKAAILDRRTQAFVRRTQNYSYQTLTPDAETGHLQAFLITIEPRQAHAPVAYKHEGEEFVFVLEGELELTLGGKPHHLKPRESMRFNSDTPHKLRSLSEESTRCLVVLYTP